MMRTLYRFLFGSLRGRLIVGVAVVHAVMMALFIADLTVRQRSMLLDRQVETANALSHALAVSAAGWIAAADISGLQELADAQRNYPEIVFAILTDTQGRILADTEGARTGLYLQDLPDIPSQTTIAGTPTLVDVATPAMISGRHVGWVRVGIGQKAAGEKLAEITMDGVAYALAAILVGSLIAWFMGRQITRRLYAVQETIDAVRAGNRQARSSLAGTDEAAVMSREFNRMLDMIVEKDAELRDKTAELDHYFSDALDLLCIADTDGHFLRLNPQWETTLGFPLSELIGKRYLDFVHPDDVAETLEAMAGLAAQKEVLNFINRYRTKNGEFRWIEWRAFPSGSRIYAVARDITERKRTEEALRRSEEDLTRAQAVAETGSWYLDIPGNQLQWSAETCRIFGIPHDQPLTLGTFAASIFPEDRQRVLQAWNAATEGAPYDIEHRIIVGNRTKWVRERADVIFAADGRALRGLGTVQDITERKLAEETLREREAFIRNILDSVDEGFIVINREYRIVSANKAFCGMVKLPEHEVLGRPCYEISHNFLRPCFELGEDCAVRSTFESGGIHLASHVHERAAGVKQYMELKAFPITDSSGTVVSVIETVNDVTEKIKLEEQLRQAQKMEAIGTLAGGVSHDFNNMLGVIIGHAEMAMRQANVSHPCFASLQEIRKAAGRSADLTRQLLAFARKQSVAPKVLDLNGTVEGMLKMLRRLIGEEIDLAWLPGTALWHVKVDPSQIDQILANLCVNARDAIAGVGKVTIETRNAAIDTTYSADHPEAVPGEYILLAVSDTGCGMDRRTIGKIFEPFFTTKELGKGTGLGLATVYGIVKQNNGFINVYSEPGQGSTFKIYLPRHAAESGEIPEEVSAAPLARGEETILLVEDEPDVLNMTRQILEEFGYRVLAASAPSEAIRLATESIGEIRLLITDMVLPEMNGRELAKVLHSLAPEMKLLFMSGYAGGAIVHQRGDLDNEGNFIQKPFSIHALATKVREVLDGG